MELLLPLLVVDLVLGWMVWTTWRGHQVWMGLDMGSKDQNRTFWWMSLIRLLALLLLALVGTVAACRAM
jgi:hypothetical protein